LQTAAAEWRDDRRQLVKQPLHAHEAETTVEKFESSSSALATRLAEFFSAH
jgi:hypothetical protein